MSIIQAMRSNLAKSRLRVLWGLSEKWGSTVITYFLYLIHTLKGEEKENTFEEQDAHRNHSKIQTNLFFYFRCRVVVVASNMFWMLKIR